MAGADVGRVRVKLMIMTSTTERTSATKSCAFLSSKLDQKFNTTHLCFLYTFYE